jgi:hypothetical protein
MFAEVAILAGASDIETLKKPDERSNYERVGHGSQSRGCRSALACPSAAKGVSTRTLYQSFA